MGLLNILRAAQQIGRIRREQPPSRRQRLRVRAAPQWRHVAPDGRELKISYDRSGRWLVVIASDWRTYRAVRLGDALAEATHDAANSPWIVALEDQLQASVI